MERTRPKRLRMKYFDNFMGSPEEVGISSIETMLDLGKSLAASICRMCELSERTGSSFSVCIRNHRSESNKKECGHSRTLSAFSVWTPSFWEFLTHLQRCGSHVPLQNGVPEAPFGTPRFRVLRARRHSCQIRR